MSHAAGRAVVWFKKDLRVFDHEPLVRAAQFPNAVGLYVIEPEWLASPEFASQHLAYVLESLHELRQKLARLGMPLLVRTGEITQVLDEIASTHPFACLLSHEETGSFWTYQRDLAVAKWCERRQVQWHEFAQTGVVRRLKNRNTWAFKWNARMSQPLQVLPSDFAWGSALDPSAYPIPNLKDFKLHNDKIPITAGETAARQTLRSFINGRCMGYRQAMSSPITAQDTCSRLSAHLSFGTISMRYVHQMCEQAIEQTTNRDIAYALRGFSGRLRWHCHFMQKLEDEPRIEFENFARCYDGIRQPLGQEPKSLEFFHAWCEGKTGYPMVDACMRQLRATGWLNFRMRAMLVSFASYHLWLHWRETGLFLASQFLDFEPGIHWSQMQMQSGTTGINVLRMYSPSKQALDHDPQGIYAAQWIPELHTTHYPEPIVQEKEALAQAKERMYAIRKSVLGKEQAQAVLQKHGSRKKSSVKKTPSKRAVKKTKDDQGGQGELF